MDNSSLGDPRLHIAEEFVEIRPPDLFQPGRFLIGQVKTPQGLCRITKKQILELGVSYGPADHLLYTIL